MKKAFDLVNCIALIVMVLGVLTYSSWWLYDTIWGDWAHATAQVTLYEPDLPKTYTFLPNESLWTVYELYYQGHDWEQVRYEIGVLNGLKNDRVDAYQVIQLPEVM